MSLSTPELNKDAKFKQDGTPKNSLAKLKKKLLDLAKRIEQIGEKDQKPKGLLLSGDNLYILFRSQNPDYQESEPFLELRKWNWRKPQQEFPSIAKSFKNRAIH